MTAPADRPAVPTAVTATFPRAARLTTQAEFRRVFAQPRVSQDRCFRMLVRPNELGRARLGLAVSVKVSRRAVGRNRLKRLVRESFRRHAEVLAPAGGIDIVVLPSRDAATMCNPSLTKSLAAHWRRCATLHQGGDRTGSRNPSNRNPGK